MPGHVRIGTASWTDPGFIADWYPRTLPASDRLLYYAERFDLVEVNSSFYAVPGRRVVQRWCEQTPEGFLFNVKLHRLFSRHSTSPKALPASLRDRAEVHGDKVVFTPELEKALAALFLQEISPLRNSGKLGALLLQLTPSFGPPRHKLEELDSLMELLAEYPLAIELRNRHWLAPERSEETVSFFKKRRRTLVTVDAPKTEHFMAMPRSDVVTSDELAYVRLHGRNVKGYLTGKTVAERFDYLYSEEELAELAKFTLGLAQKATRTHVIYNNNSSDYALRNAATFQQMLGELAPETASNRRAPKPVAAPHWGKTLEFDFGSVPSPPKPRER